MMPSFNPAGAAIALALGTLLCLTPSAPAADFSGVDAAIHAAIRDRACRGAVVIIGRAGGVLYRKSYGHAALEPKTRAMTDDTIFDLASLTKPLATAASVLLLVEQGKLGLDDPVARHLPGFGVNGKDTLTVRQCLIHTAGFIADNPMKDYTDGPAVAVERIRGLGLRLPPGEKFVYSDVGYIVLGLVVEQVAGRPVDQFALDTIYRPLGMRDTGFRPDPALLPRIAPTEPRGPGQPMVAGVVHDPRAFALGGVAGHAGLFGTADDVARFCRMLLNRGELDGVRVMKPETVDRMLTPLQAGADGTVRRSLGFDAQSRYSSPRGARFAPDSVGHTGWTGTSLWIDRENDCFVVLLTSRLHPDGKGDVKDLRHAVSTAAADALGIGSP